MSSVIRRDWYGVKRSDTFHIVPIGDIHLGNAACEEDRLKRVVASIAERDNAYWIGVGDYCDFINVRDPRFEAESLADWVSVADFGDLARVQREKFLDIVKPIAPKCLCLLEGNHEGAIKHHYERDVYYEIVAAIKGWGGQKRLALGPSGWLVLYFYRGKGKKKKAGGAKIVFSLHHGFVGGRLAGAKALNMQRWLWSHQCDVAIFGHSHNTSVQVEGVECLTASNEVETKTRYGVFSGSFLVGAKYAQRYGFFPQPGSGVEIVLRPGSERKQDRIKVLGQ